MCLMVLASCLMVLALCDGPGLVLDGPGIVFRPLHAFFAPVLLRTGSCTSTGSTVSGTTRSIVLALKNKKYERTKCRAMG